MIFNRRQLKAALAPVRDLLCQEWDWLKRDMPDHVREPLSQDMCRLSTAYLYSLFHHAGMTGWSPAEGHPFIDDFNVDSAHPTGGLLSRDQVWKAHAWLEHDQGWILDLTADQFGYAEIMIARSTDSRFKKNLSQQVIMTRLNECELSLRWLETHLREAESRKILDNFTSCMNHAPQLNMSLKRADASLEQVAL